MTHRTLPLIALAAALTPLAAAETQSFDIGAFTAIDTRGAINVIYTPGETSLSAEEDTGDFSDLYLENDGDTLIISRKSLRDENGWYKNVSMRMKGDDRVIKIDGEVVPAYTVRVSGPSLVSAYVARSSDMEASGIDADTFNGSVSSSGDLKLTGRAGTVSLDGSSSGDLDASELLASALEIDSSSSSDVWGTVTDGPLTIDASSSSDVTVTATGATLATIDASSSSDIELTGTCGAAEISASSSADVEASDFACTDGTIRGSSGADISANIVGNLFARASSGADISVDGNPASADVKESSGGDISY